MPVINRIAEFHGDMKEWRRHLHSNPELGFECHDTAAFVIERLRKFGITEIHQGIAKTGIVAIINGQCDGPTIGLRADMDALPIVEAGNPPYKSKIDGIMHACGHDGHTAMLLGAAKYLNEIKRFAGRVALIFQPAEEGGGGGKVMCEEGIMDRFSISQVFALHNWPGAPLGLIGSRPGPFQAATDQFEISIKGKGGHAAMAHETVDSVMIAVQIASALQTIVSRNVDPVESVVLSVTQILSGSNHNVVPGDAVLRGTVRTMKPAVQERVMERMNKIVTQMAQAMGGKATLSYHQGYPALVNHPDQTTFAVDVAKELVGPDLSDGNYPPDMGGEDFAYMLQERPGAYLYLGTGNGVGLHSPEFDFNDDALPIGASFYVRLVENAHPLS